jgi:hypothetical protein
MTLALSEMSMAELHAEFRAARFARQAAEYQDVPSAYRAQLAAADERLAAVNAEIDARLAALAPDRTQGTENGG